MSDFIEQTKKDLVEFYDDSVNFMRQCSKPNKQGNPLSNPEFIKMASSCAIGFAIMGVVGFLIKLVFIPINRILLS